ncbi:MAG: CAP domain-containing protein [Patescibacteria group bacterium]|nr:CAP domain-containing protein [Patescibacteria group bacterium]
MNWRHLFLPHPQTHQKAKLLHWHALVTYIVLFVFLQIGFSVINTYKPGVLGITSSISSQDVIKLTNVERQKDGLSTLAENSELSAAALAKAKDMFAENYWAHYSPSGKDPWSFMTAQGYRFTYAGENLAKNFYDSQSVVTAWMNSPSHRENMLNSHYQEIGVAVLDGVLNGQQTTLVVQMFGTPIQSVAAKPAVDSAAKQVAIVTRVPTPANVQPVVSNNLVAGTTVNYPNYLPLIDPYMINRILSIFIIMLISSLLVMDYVVLKKRGVFRLSSHHFAHLSFLAVASSALLFSQVGSVL